MRKHLALFSIAACLLSLVILAGCGGKGGGEAKVIEDGGRKISVEGPGAEGEPGVITLEGERGELSTIQVQEQAPNEETLGAPIYPGAVYVEGSGVSGTTTSGEQQVTAAGAEFVTADDISEVVDWYRGRLGEPVEVSPQNATWMAVGREGEIVAVIAEAFEGEVKITIAKVSGDVDIRL